jgi:hypothetical protein
MKRSNFLLPVFAILTACASAAAALASDQSPAPKLAAGDAASTSSSPMIVQNPDGTFTAQKTPSPAQPGAKEGLVIPPQIVVPLMPRR